jgi:hypothetical protein
MPIRGGRSNISCTRIRGSSLSTNHVSTRRPRLSGVFASPCDERHARTSVLSPDAGCLASVVSKELSAWERHCCPVPQRRTDAGASAASSAISDVAASPGKRCVGATSILIPRVMPIPMSIGSRSQSVAVGPIGRSVFRRRSQTVPVRLRRLSGNADTGSTGIEGLNPLAE